MEFSNGGSSSCTQYGVEKLVSTNYKYWRMCMEAYLQGQDLWDLVVGADTEIPIDTPDNSEPRRKWKIKCGKALFALRSSVSKELIDHIRDVNSPKQVWETLEKVFLKKHTSRLQFLENELARTKQEGMSISEYFLRIKNMCAEISELDATEKVSEARLRRNLIRGLKTEYTPFITSIQGWANQPTVEELENLLSNQEALAKQMAKAVETDAVLFTRGKNTSRGKSFTKNPGEKKHYSGGGNFEGKQASDPIKCFRCGKLGHIRKNCRVKLSKANVALEERKENQWEHCLTAELLKQRTKALPHQHQIRLLQTTIITKKSGSLILVAHIM